MFCHKVINLIPHRTCQYILRDEMGTFCPKLSTGAVATAHESAPNNIRKAHVYPHMTRMQRKSRQNRSPCSTKRPGRDHMIVIPKVCWKLGCKKKVRKHYAILTRKTTYYNQGRIDGFICRNKFIFCTD